MSLAPKFDLIMLAILSQTAIVTRDLVRNVVLICEEIDRLV